LGGPGPQAPGPGPGAPSCSREKWFQNYLCGVPWIPLKSTGL